MTHTPEQNLACAKKAYPEYEWVVGRNGLPPYRIEEGVTKFISFHPSMQIYFNLERNAEDREKLEEAVLMDERVFCLGYDMYENNSWNLEYFPDEKTVDLLKDKDLTSLLVKAVEVLGGVE